MRFKPVAGETTSSLPMARGQSGQHPGGAWPACRAGAAQNCVAAHDPSAAGEALQGNMNKALRPLGLSGSGEFELYILNGNVRPGAMEGPRNHLARLC